MILTAHRSLFLCLLACVTSSSPAAGAARSNIVVILADDLGYGDLGVYNAASKIPTPRLDRLASEGLRFTDAHTPASVCTPTRYGLLTGRYPWRSRLKSGVLNGYSPALIEDGRLTLASLLAGKGYRTACIGKWHLGLGTAEPADFAAELAPGPNAAGFAESFILPASLDMPPYVFVENTRATVQPTGHVAASKMRRYGGEGFWREGAIAPGFEFVETLPTLADRAINYLEQQDGTSPFFLYFPLTAPHTPWMPKDEFRGKSKAGYYGDFVAQVDATIGRVLDVLAERKLVDNTLVIVTSDNGAHWLPSDIVQWQHQANADWRGQKADIWEGGHRVPLIVRWPGVVRGGETSKQLVCLTDLVATIAEIVERPLEAGEAEDSFSFLSVLTGAKQPGPLRDAVVHQAVDGTLAIRQGSWKLVDKLGSHGFSEPHNVVPRPGDPAGQLYDLATDPGETRNRWLDEPGIVARLRAQLEAYQETTYTRPQNR